MTKVSCKNEDCTVTQTGICLQGHKKLSECPDFERVEESVSPEVIDSKSDEMELSETTAKPIMRRFHSGNELDIEDVTDIMRGHYTHLIGILGAYNAGKTCFLSSLYLMASCGELQPDYLFAGSFTLPGFEIRARRLRKWSSGTLPEKLTDHTYLQDPNIPAFMHLALQEKGVRGRRHELLLTDLPGEWSTSLVDRAETASRFEFLKRADGIIFVIEGPLLALSESRNAEIFRAKLLLKRLIYNVQVDKHVPLVILISKCDILNMKAPDGVSQIKDEAMELGFNATVILAASFSSVPDKIPSGTGVLKAFETILNYNWPKTELPLMPSDKISTSRSFGRFRLA